MRIVVPVAVCIALAVPCRAQTGQAAVAQGTIAIIPQPVKVAPASGRFQVTPKTVIWTDQASRSIGHQLARYLEPATGFTLNVQTAGAAPAGAIQLRRDPTLKRLGAEGYTLEVRSKGRRLIGWDEILEGGLAENAVVMSWRGVKGGIEAARAKHDVVMAPTTHTYLDYRQSKDPRDGLAIGGFLPLETVYGYEPIPDELEPQFAKHVLGAQAQLWTEYMPNPKRVEYMAFPRLTALAEVVWTPKERKDYAGYLQRLDPHLRRLTALDVNFRPLDK